MVKRRHWETLVGKTIVVEINRNIMPAVVIEYFKSNKSVKLKLLDFDGFPNRIETFYIKDVKVLEVLS